MANQVRIAPVPHKVRDLDSRATEDPPSKESNEDLRNSSVVEENEASSEKPKVTIQTEIWYADPLENALAKSGKKSENYNTAHENALLLATGMLYPELDSEQRAFHCLAFLIDHKYPTQKALRALSQTKHCNVEEKKGFQKIYESYVDSCSLGKALKEVKKYHSLSEIVQNSKPSKMSSIFRQSFSEKAK